MNNRRIRDYGIKIGEMKTGRLNKITDVPGVRVGHCTVNDRDHNTGVTVIMPCQDNPFVRKPVAAAFVHNGFGKTAGLVQIEELGTLETPVALTNTLNVGLVHDALVEIMVERCRAEAIPVRSINPVVGECNDSRLNRITERVIGIPQVREAMNSLTDDFDEGDVGAGKGTTTNGLKGGIGSASRIMKIDGQQYTLGVLVQSNYGRTSDLTVNGQNIGPEILNRITNSPEYPNTVAAECDQGSIMMIVATDLPVNERQLKRIIRRCGVGLARCGSYLGHGSGEIMIGWTTSNSMPSLQSNGEEAGDIVTMKVLKEDLLDYAFRAVAEATEEAVLNSMVCADNVVGPDGNIIYSLNNFMELYKHE